MILLQVPLLDVVTHHTLKGIGQKSTGRGVITHREFIKSVFSEIACRPRVITIVFQHFFREDIREMLVDKVQQIRYTDARTGNG